MLKKLKFLKLKLSYQYNNMNKVFFGTLILHSYLKIVFNKITLNFYLIVELSYYSFILVANKNKNKTFNENKTIKCFQTNNKF